MTVPPFPNAVCWDVTRRAAVLNPIALDVPLSVFRATHHPSLVQREGTAAGTLVAIDEGEILEEFLSPAQTHIFMAAVGDTGTGKSHLIRWLELEVASRSAGAKVPPHIVPIPRSAANLADVVRRILQNFGGEATARLRAEVERHRGLSESEARQRVLDELAIVIENLPKTDAEDDEASYLREKLPALLRDHEIRRALTQPPEGIITRLARHVLGQRESAQPELLRWTPTDLELPVHAIGKSGADASELASGLLNDDRLRSAATLVLDRALGPAIAALLRFRSGDLKRALNEIRAQLASQGRELILLLEDLSITEGLDGELLEALQVRTHDSGTELCTLRSIVGLTREDYQRLRDNIKARVTRTLWFEAPIGHGTTASEDVALAEFAARYLNAIRLEAFALDEWAAGDAIPSHLPNACEICINRAVCHDAFGAVDGFGLYPLTAVALGRLYRRVVRVDAAARAFKPRSLLKVLTDTLDEAERGVARRDFPTAALIKSFGLGSTTAELQLALRNEFGADGDRILRAMELYADQPAVTRPVLRPGVATAFGMQIPAWTSAVARQQPAPQPSPEPKAEEPAPALDVCDQWLRGDTPADKTVNAWRQMILEAVQAAIEWDVEGIAYLRSAFGARSIQIEGQKTRTVDPVLTLTRTPEAAVTLRTLTEGGLRVGEGLLRTARIQIDRWALDVRTSILRRSLPSGDVDGIQVGVELLAVGAFLRGSRPAGEGPLLDACMRPDWSPELGRGRGDAWNAVLKAYVKHGTKVRDVIHHALSCTKGGQAGAFVEPSHVIATLRALRRGALPALNHDDTIEWGAFREVGQLAREVSQHLPVALKEERQAAEEWLALVAQHLGTDSPADVFPRIAEALEAAAGVGFGDSALRKAIADLQGRPLKGCLDCVQKVIAAPDESALLVALGSLDRTLMKSIAEAVELSSKVLVEMERRLQERLHDALGSKTPEEWLAEIHDRLTRIDTAYAELHGREQQNG
jgi:hypothetical protein